MHRLILALGGLAALLLLAVSPTLAGKGGGKPGGGDPPPADPAIAYAESGKFGVEYLCVANADGSNATRIVETNDMGDLDWSPTGDRLCFFSEAPDAGLYVVGADGTGLTCLFTQPDLSLLYGRNPSWCPVAASDGQHKIVFSKRVPNTDGSWGPADLFLINPDGTGLMNLTNTPEAWESNASWSPDGRRLAVGEDHQTTHEVHLYYLDAAGTAIVGSECISDAGPLADRDVYRPRWAKTRDELAVWVHEPGLSHGHLWVIEVSDPYNPDQITSSPDYTEMAAAWSEDDSQWLYWAKRVKGASQYGGYLMASDGSDAPGEFLLPHRWAFAWRR
ncbi:MAG: TolB family protein [Planctomycetota bacterium]